jgi:hypothetical protein
MGKDLLLRCGHKGENPMNPKDGPGLVDVLVTIFSPLIVMVVLTMVFLLGWWVEAGWCRVRGITRR